MVARTFEECYSEIEKIVEKKRGEWTFKASLMLDFDDIKTEIITHIWKKWHLYDQSRPLGAWVSVTTKHQFSNILRDIYQSTSSPCLKCPCNRGENVCSEFGEQSVACPLYAKWYKTKRHAHNARLPVALENHLNEVYDKPETPFDLERAIELLHGRIKAVLTNSEWDIYQRLYVQHKSEEDTAQELGFKTNESGRKMGYKRIRQVKTIIVKKAKKLIADQGIDTI